MSAQPCGCDLEAHHQCDRHLLRIADERDLNDRMRDSLRQAVQELSQAHDRIAELKCELQVAFETNAGLRRSNDAMRAVLLRRPGTTDATLNVTLTEGV